MLHDYNTQVMNNFWQYGVRSTLGFDLICLVFLLSMMAFCSAFCFLRVMQKSGQGSHTPSGLSIVVSDTMYVSMFSTVIL